MHWLWAADGMVFHAIYGTPRGALPRGLASLLLRIGTGGALWLILFALLFLGGGRRGRRVALTGALAVLLAHAAAVWGLQGLFQRAGPSATYPGVTLLARWSGPFSFPAGRVAQAFAAAPLLTRGSGAGPVVVWSLVIGVAYASIYIGASFPTDAAAGAAVGLACAGGAVWLLGDPFRRRAGLLLPLPRRQRHPAARTGGRPRGAPR